MKVRITGAPKEVQELAELLPAVMKVSSVSGEYPSRGSNDVRVYVDGSIKPRSNDVNEIIFEALKDYRGNNEVIVTTTSGGSIYIEDYNSSELVSKNEELEEEVDSLKVEIDELNQRIEELEEELEKYA